MAIKLTSTGLLRVAEAISDDCDYVAVGTGETEPTVGDSTLETETHRSTVSQRIVLGNKFQIRTLHRNSNMPDTLEELGIFMNDTSGDMDSGELLVRATEEFTKGGADLLSVFEITLEEA